MRTLLFTLSLFSTGAAACVPPVGLSHIVPAPSELRGSVGGGPGTNGPVATAAVGWNSRRGKKLNAGMSTAVTWSITSPDPISGATESPRHVTGLAPYGSVWFGAGPLDISVPMFFLAGQTGPGLYSDVGVIAMTGAMLSHERGPVTVFGGALSSVIGVQDRLQMSFGARIRAKNGAALTAEVIYMNDGQQYRSATTSSLQYRRNRSALFQLHGSFGKPVGKKPRRTPRRSTRKPVDPELIGGASSMIGTGYLLPMFPVAFTLADDHENKNQAALNFIPIVGGLLFVHSTPPGNQPIVGGGREYVMVYTSALTQIAGVAMLVAANVDARWIPTPTAMGHDGMGLAISGRF